jgi:hypothetical protein
MSVSIEWRQRVSEMEIHSVLTWLIAQENLIPKIAWNEKTIAHVHFRDA